MNKLILAAGVLAACALAGCNTIQGFGKDLQSVGAVVAGTADGVQKGATPSSQAAPASAAPASCQPDTNGLLPAGCQ